MANDMDNDVQTIGYYIKHAYSGAPLTNDMQGELNDALDRLSDRLAALETQNEEPLALDARHVNTLQELITAVAHLPRVLIRVNAFMREQDIDDPVAEIQALSDLAFGRRRAL